jgi:hypothetical protein
VWLAASGWKMKSALAQRVIAFFGHPFHVRAERYIQHPKGVTVNLNVNHFSQLTTGIKFSQKQAALPHNNAVLLCTMCRAEHSFCLLY